MKATKVDQPASPSASQLPRNLRRGTVKRPPQLNEVAICRSEAQPMKSCDQRETIRAGVAQPPPAPMDLVQHRS